jgi:hypothetical protein
LITGLVNRVEILSQRLSGMHGFENVEELMQTLPESDPDMIRRVSSKHSVFIS